MAQEDKIIFCTGGGCTAKLGAGVLSHILENLPRGEPENTLYRILGPPGSAG